MAADRSRAMTQLCDLTQCCICLKTFTDPRMLPCIHTFCFQCLQALIKKSNKKPGDEMQCPVCRKDFVLSSDGIQGAQKNFFMASLIELRIALNRWKRFHLCDICKANNDTTVTKISRATLRCLNCAENLCKGCCNMHKSFKVLKNHKILKLGSEIEEVDVIKSLQVMNCDFHRGKPLDYYCADCKKVVCVSCFVESHKAHDCKDVNTVEEEFRQSIRRNARIISTLAEEVQNKRKKKESKEEFLKKITIEERKILQRSKELKDMIDEHTKSLLSSLDEIKKRHLKEIQMEEEELDRHLTILESFSRYCDELRSKGSASEVCRNQDGLLRRADELEEDHEGYIMHPRMSFDVTFQATKFNSWRTTINGNIVGMIKENVEQLEEIFVMIGGDQNMYKINLCHRSETVSCIQDIPTRVHDTAAAVYDNTMFITGVGETLNEIWKYSFASGWKRCGSLVERRLKHCAEFLGKMLYIFGGRLEANVMDSIEAYNAMTEKSSKVGHLKIGVYRAACVAYNGSIYVFGGLDEDATALDCVQVFSSLDETCTLLSTRLPRPQRFFRAFLWETYAIVLGLDTCFILSLNEMIWQERQQFKTDAVLFGMAFENGRIFVIDEGVMEAEKYCISPYKWKGEVKFIRASSIVNNEAANWKTYLHLPKPVVVLTAAKLSLVK